MYSLLRQHPNPCRWNALHRQKPKTQTVHEKHDSTWFDVGMSLNKWHFNVLQNIFCGTGWTVPFMQLDCINLIQKKKCKHIYIRIFYYHLVRHQTYLTIRDKKISRPLWYFKTDADRLHLALHPNGGHAPCRRTARKWSHSFHGRHGITAGQCFWNRDREW